MKTGILILLLAAMVILFGAGAALADCKDTTIQCWGKHLDTGEYSVPCGEITVGACWYKVDWMCWPCASFKGSNGMCDYQDDCLAAFPNCCKGGGCSTYWKKGPSVTSCGEGPWSN